MPAVKRIVVPALLLTLLVVAPGAQARTVSYLNFHSPSKRIGCAVERFGGPGLECSSPDINRLGDLDPYFRIAPRGRARVGERGDFDGFSVRSRTLRYGQTWRRFEVRCTMRRSGLTCRNRSRHGFHIAIGDTRLF
jgi:uncharacterized protein DUF6636